MKQDRYWETPLWPPKLSTSIDWPQTGLEERSQLEVERGWEKCGIDLLEADFWPA